MNIAPRQLTSRLNCLWLNLIENVNASAASACPHRKPFWPPGNSQRESLLCPQDPLSSNLTYFPRIFAPICSSHLLPPSSKFGLKRDHLMSFLPAAVTSSTPATLNPGWFQRTNPLFKFWIKSCYRYPHLSVTFGTGGPERHSVDNSEGDAS